MKSEIINKFLEGKDESFKDKFDEFYHSVEDTIELGGVCMFSYVDIISDLGSDFVEIMKFFSNNYNIKLRDYTGVTLMHEAEGDTVIDGDSGLTFEITRK